LYFAASAGLHLRNFEKTKHPGIYLQAGLKQLSFRTNYGYNEVVESNGYLSNRPWFPILIAAENLFIS